MKSTWSNGQATIGLPNAIKLLEVIDDDGAGADVTGKFRLVNNQNDNFYGISYITTKSGATVSNNNLRIKVKVLKRTSNLGSGYISSSSYNSVPSKNLIQNHVGKNGVTYNLIDSFDFRPYLSPVVSYAVGVSGAPSASVVATTVVLGVQPSNDSSITSTQSYYMSRMDSVVIDELGDITLYEGGEAENPSIPELRGLYAINNIFVPGNITTVSGNNRIKLSDVSNKNYTMKQIGAIEARIDRLVDLVSLSLLETNAKDFYIDDGAGSNRFKNGILVDAFKGMQNAALADPRNLRQRLIRQEQFASPSVMQFPVDLKVGASSGANSFKRYRNFSGHWHKGHNDLTAITQLTLETVCQTTTAMMASLRSVLLLTRGMT